MGESETKKETFILDTNVLIKDPGAPFSIAKSGAEVIIPSLVIQELGNMKSENTSRGRKARKALNLLDQRTLTFEGGDLFRGVKVGDEGGLLYSSVHYTNNISHRELSSLTPDLDPSNPDSKIVQLARFLEKQGKDPIVMTGDTHERVCCQQYGLKFKKWVFKDNIFRGYRTVTNPGLIDKFLESHYISEEDAAEAVSIDSTEEEDLQEWKPNEYLCIRYEERDTKGKSALVLRYDANQKRFIDTRKSPSKNLNPRNDLQVAALDAILTPEIQHVFLIGAAGSAKTFLSVYGGYIQSVRKGSEPYEYAIITRPKKGTGDEDEIGFLPGGLIDKISAWHHPVIDNLRAIQRVMGEAKNLFTFSELKLDQNPACDSWYVEQMDKIRGRSLEKVYMIVDEAQNATPHALLAAVTRVGEGGKIILTGDPSQSDRWMQKVENPLVEKSNLYSSLNSTATICFPNSYCERSGSVRNILELEDRV